MRRHWKYAAKLLVALAAMLLAAPGAVRAESVTPGQDFDVPDLRLEQAEPLPEPQAIAPDAALSEMVGQMVMVGFLGTSTSGEWIRTLGEQVRNGEVGGVFFLGRNVSSRSQVAELAAYFSDAGARFPLLVSVDQEGGFVQRLSHDDGFTLIPSALRMAENYGEGAARDIYAAVAAELAGAGFNVNFAPVVDLNTNPSNPIIGGARRSYSDDPELVARYAAILVDAHRRRGVLTALKHFPGHGSSSADSHETLVDISATWRETELEPYRMLFADGYSGMVMVGHLFNASLDDGARRPATFSPQVIGGLLRGRLGFDGVVITDDLEMGAIREAYSLDEAVLNAIVAGNDILLFSQSERSDIHLPGRVLRVVQQAIAQGTLTEARIMESYARIVALKSTLPAN